MRSYSEFWTLYHNYSYFHKKNFCLKLGAEFYQWDQPWRERKKSKIWRQQLNHLMKLARGCEGRGTGWKCQHFVTLSTHRKSTVFGCSKYALAHPGFLPPFLLRNLPGTAGELLRENQKVAVVLQDGWKDTTASTKTQGFPGKGGYAAACTARLPLLEIKECLFSLKGMFYPGQGTQSLNPATPSHQKYERQTATGRINGYGVTIQAYICD